MLDVECNPCVTSNNATRTCVTQLCKHVLHIPLTCTSNCSCPGWAEEKRHSEVLLWMMLGKDLISGWVKLGGSVSCVEVTFVKLPNGNLLTTREGCDRIKCQKKLRQEHKNPAPFLQPILQSTYCFHISRTRINVYSLYICAMDKMIDTKESDNIKNQNSTEQSFF